MNTSPSPFVLPDTAPELARRFAVIMAGLAALVARRFLRMPHLVGLIGLLWGRLDRAVRRLHRALTVPAKAYAARTRADHQARPAQMRLPLRRGWIVRELGWEAAGYMAQLDALLAEATSITALAAAPRAARIIRPICRMLGVVAPLPPPPIAAAMPAPALPAHVPEIGWNGGDFVAALRGPVFSGI